MKRLIHNYLNASMKKLWVSRKIKKKLKKIYLQKKTLMPLKGFSNNKFVRKPMLY